MAIPAKCFNWQSLETPNGFMFCSILWVKAEIYKSFANDDTWAVVLSHGGFKGGFKSREKAIQYAEKEINNHIEQKYKICKFHLDLLKKYENYFNEDKQ